MLALLAFGSLILSLERRRLLRVLQLRTVGRVVLLLLGTASLIGCGSGWRTKAWSMNITATSGQLSAPSRRCSSPRARPFGDIMPHIGHVFGVPFQTHASAYRCLRQNFLRL